MFIYICVCVRMCCVHAHAIANGWRSEKTLQEYALSSHHVGPGDRTTAGRLVGRKHLYLLSHLTALVASL